MALFAWPPQYNLFQYLRLKIIVTLLRVFVNITERDKIKSDEALVPNNVRQESTSIPSRDLGRRIAVNIYYPLGHSSTRPTSVLINWHGSGFILPLLGSDVAFCSRVAQEAGIVVVDADYRKGPEHPFPGALNDVEDTLQWVATLNPKNVGLSGFSAGACLALEAASTLRIKHNKLNIRAALCFWPITDLAKAPEDKKIPRPIKPHPIWALHLFNECYAPDQESRTNPAVSPSFVDVANFPPLMAFIVCEGDPLRPEATQLADRIQEQKDYPRDVVLHILEGVPHGFDKGAKNGTLDWVRREEAYELAIKLLKQAFHDRRS